MFAQPKVIAYLPVYGIQPPVINKSIFQKITHLNLAFLRADSSGVLKTPEWTDDIVRVAHDNHVKVLGSIGGGNTPAYYAELLNDRKRDSFINHILAFTLEHRLDGIDIDLEGSLIDNHYEIFITELSKKLKSKKKLLTAAVATWNGQKITTATLEQMDYLNVMSYDKTGPWTPDKPGPHAPVAMAEDDIRYWNVTRHVPKKKIILGVPFYGYLFGPKIITGISFKEIVTKLPGAALKDSLSLPDGTFLYYNGIPTIQTKTRLAIKKTGGVMIWQLLQDTEGENSLLGIIDATIHVKRKKGK